MKFQINRLLFVVALAALSNGCSSRAKDNSVQSVAQTNASEVRIFQVEGTIEGIDLTNLQAKIKHADIPGYMPAMTMDFKVPTANELEGLAVNDSVDFRLNVSRSTHWIDRIKKLSSAPQSDPATNLVVSSQSGWSVMRDVKPLDIGDRMPNFRFTNELGVAVTLDSIKGQAYAFTFIFTRCPLPDFCPRMSSNFSELQKELKHTSPPISNWHLFSLTMDPEFDTPLVLKTYASRFNYDSKCWNFLTGSLIDISTIGELFGLEVYRPDGTFVHNLRTVVVSPSGIVQNIIIGNNWKPEELAKMIIAAIKK